MRLHVRQEWKVKLPRGRANSLENIWGLPRFDDLTISDWERNFYEKGSKQLANLPLSHVWLRSVENAGTRVAEFVRREEYKKAIESLGDAFGLLCCFVRRFDEHHKIHPLSDIAWNKYPGMCYACADKVPESEAKGEGYVSCICLGMQGKPDDEEKGEERLEYARRERRKPKTLDEWSNMIKSIYKEAHSVLPISAICLHFIEEIGEVTRELYEFEEMQKRSASERELAEKVVKLEEEIADTFSWILGLINKIDQLFEKARDYYKRKAQLRPLKASRIARDALKVFPRKHE